MAGDPWPGVRHWSYSSGSSGHWLSHGGAKVLEGEDWNRHFQGQVEREELAKEQKYRGHKQDEAGLVAPAFSYG